MTRPPSQTDNPGMLCPPPRTAIGSSCRRPNRTAAATSALDRQRAINAGRLVEGATVQGWKAALGALALHYPDRIGPYIN